MGVKKTAPYGSWESPIASDIVASGARELEQVALDGKDVYWIEMRPNEGGRYVIMRRTGGGKISDAIPPVFSAHSRIHEYGGGSFVVADGMVVFSNSEDQRLYQMRLGSLPQQLTLSPKLRYADGIIDSKRRRLICVREDHSGKECEPVNTLVFLKLDEVGDGEVLVSGNDFYSSPRLSPDGTRLAWLTWNHPNMPWDETELWIARLTEAGALESAERIVGGNGESVFQPEWSPDGVLYFVSDRRGWWNLCRWNGDHAEPLCEVEAEFGVPQWTFGLSTYAFESADQIICTFTQEGVWQLASLDTRTRRLQLLNIPYTEIWGVRATQGRVVCCAGSPTEPASIVEVQPSSSHFKVLYRSSAVSIDSKYISNPVPTEFPTTNGETAHAFFYPPRNTDYAAPPGERPPLLVKVHGGPTSAATSIFNLGIQYWTSRGIAVLDVNYRGSSGYGRAYRQRLNGNWGILDVDDCVSGALYFVERGKADGNRLAISGRSAGGYTTLCALTFRETFNVGASYFGLSDLESFVRETHKFESHYLEYLIGPYPARADLYRERSPINFADRISCPVIFFQGLEDKIVPPNQAESMVQVLQAKGIPVAYVKFEGEGHGFRRAENIKRALTGELYFYSRIFLFKPAEIIEPLSIENSN